MKKETIVGRTRLLASWSLILLLGLSIIGAAQDSTWERKTDMPAENSHMGTALVDTKFYLIAGHAGGANRFFKVYDTQRDTWIMKADLPVSIFPEPISSPAACEIDGKIYVMGGGPSGSRDEPPSPSATTLKVYTLASDSWTLKANMPTIRTELSAVAVNGKIYVIGGVARSSGWYWDLAEATADELVSAVEVYDPETDTWTKKTDMPTARCGMGTVVVAGKIYTIGGLADNGKIMNVVEVYDPGTDTWTQKADMPTARWNLGAVEANGKVYAVCGNLLPPWEDGTVTLVEVYDPNTDSWTKGVDMNFPRQAASIGQVNGEIYAIGGFSDGNITASSIVESYDTGSGIQVRAVSPWHTGFPNPQVGTIDGGERITISGNRFPPDSIVTIDGNPLTQMKVTDALITGLTPPGRTGEQAVMITTPSLDSGIFAGQFIYLSPADTILTGISPIQGRIQGGEIGKITGGGFRTGATVSIGNVDAANVFVTPTIITFTIPSGIAGKVDISVKNPDGKSIILSRAYTYIGPPTIWQIKVTEEENMTGGFSASSQPLIPVNPYLELTIDGTGFIQTPTVFFGTRPARQVEFISSEKLRATLPQIFFSVGPLDVVATNSDGQSGVLSNGVTVLGPIRIKSINPTRGGLGGGTKITIVCESTVEFQGTVFPSRFVEDAKVFIGEAEAAEVTIQSDHIITAITPANNSGSKNVTVVNPDGSEDTFDNGFIYNPLPAITLVKPNNGKLDGGTKIEIMGSGFLLGATVQLVTGASYPEGSAIEVISISDELIVAVTPKFRGQPGLVDVWVTNPDHQSILYKDAFTYNMQPTINKISPRYGSTSGGTIIIIEGAGFLLGAKVSIGKRPATTEYKSNFQIEAVTPSNPSGTFDIKVVNPDGQETLAPAAFLSVSETVYNYPNPFRASQETTFRYVANEEVKEIKVQIFNLNGEPVGLLRQNGGGEIKWYNPDLNFGLYVYQMEVKLVTGQTRTFQKLLQVE